MRPGWIRLGRLSIVLCLLCSSVAGADTIADFTVVPPEDVLSIQVAPVPSLLRVGHTLQLSVMATFVDGTDHDVTSDPETFYTPEPETVATVSVDGLIEALAVGSVTVMVSHIQGSGELAFYQLSFCVRQDGDGEGRPDNGTDPCLVDTDGDLQSDALEIVEGTDPRVP